MVSPRVMRTMAAPVLSHLDPDLMAMMDELRGRLTAAFRAPEGSFSFAVSGTGTSAMETAVANLVGEGTRVLSIVGGYFADRLAGMSERYGGTVTRLSYEWGRAVDPDAVRRALKATPADIVTVVHAETSTGVLNPVEQIAAVAREHGALTIVDAVTSLGGHPLEVGKWGIGAAYSCAQKCVGAPSGVAPIAFSPAALERRVKARSFYFDLGLLEDYWVRRKYHHTICASLLYALREALLMVEEEGLEARWARHRHHHLALAAGLGAMGLSLLPPEPERLWTLNAIRVPDGRRRGRRAQADAGAVRHRGGRRPRPARREDLARGPDGRQLDARHHPALPGRLRVGAPGAGRAGPARRRHGRGAGCARETGRVGSSQ